MNTRLRLVAIVAVSAAVLACLIADQRERRQTVERAYSELQLLANLRVASLELHFQTTFGEIRFWSQNEEVRQGLSSLAGIWRALGESAGDQLRSAFIDRNPHPASARKRLDSSERLPQYSRVHEDLHPLLRRFIEERGYYDLFLIDPEGNVIYSVDKEDDFGTNLRSGPWRDTGLAQVFREALAMPGGEVAFVDFAPYEPSAGAPASFAAGTVSDGSGELLGIFALQTPSEPVNEIMHFTSGMGETGETYLVGEDRLMRSDSRFSESSSILKTKVDNSSVTNALEGQSGIHEILDYRDVSVLSAYVPLALNSSHWAVIAEIDTEEVLGRARVVRAWVQAISVVAGIGCALAAIFSLYQILAPDDPV